MRRYGLRAKKGLGQNFLIDSEVLDKIISAADLSPSDTVIEVGPGLGVLTEKLSEKAGNVIAIELDDVLAGILKSRLSPHGNVSVIKADVLKTEPADFFTQQKVPSYKVVANLPYYITSPAIRHFLEASVKPRVMVLMVQKEVAEQITARPGRLSVLAVSVQLYGKPTYVATVPSASFYPSPKVDSAVIKIEVFPMPAEGIDDPDSFFIIVRAGFKAARKQIGNSLAQGLGIEKPEALSLLKQAGIDPLRRAETLTLSEWATLWRTFKGNNNK